MIRGNATSKGVIAALLVSAAAGLLLVGSGAAAAADRSPGSDSNLAERSQQSKPDVNWRPDVKAARNYARGRLAGISFATVDLQGRLDKFHGGRKTIMASTFKAMVMAAYLRRNSVEDRKLTASEKGLLGPMIRVSDNNAATTLRNTVGAAAINRLAKKAGMRSFRQHPKWGLSTTSARDQARFMQSYESFIPDRHKRYARKLLATIVPSQRWGVARARPTGWDIFFKGGWGTMVGRVNHHVGFLERGRCRVSFGILTEFNPSHNYGSQTLQGIAKRLFRRLGTKRVRRACG